MWISYRIKYTHRFDDWEYIDVMYPETFIEQINQFWRENDLHAIYAGIEWKYIDKPPKAYIQNLIDQLIKNIQKEMYKAYQIIGTEKRKNIRIWTLIKNGQI